MRVSVSHTLDDLIADLDAIPGRVRRGVVKAGNESAREGNRIAKASAKESAGAHGKHYHKAFRAERVETFAWEYGPVVGPPQGGMSFEWGSRNQPPHRDLNKSADIVGPKFADRVGDAVDGAFW